MKWKEAIQLSNRRQQKKNEREGKPAHTGHVRQSNLARMFFKPEDPNDRSIQSQMTNILKGNYSQYEKAWKLLRLWCEETGTDPNFIMGFPSVHDEDFNELKQ